MSLLARFRKPGGFQQLRTLIETCEPTKQKALLQLIASEDPGWAHLVQVKTLSFSRILSWPVEILMELTPPLPDLALATIYKMAEELSKSPQSSQSRSSSEAPLHEKWLQSLPAIKAREVHLLSTNINFAAGDQMAAAIRLIQTARELEAKGQIRVSQFDPTLELDKDIAA